MLSNTLNSMPKCLFPLVLLSTSVHLTKKWMKDETEWSELFHQLLDTNNLFFLKIYLLFRWINYLKTLRTFYWFGACPFVSSVGRVTAKSIQMLLSHHIYPMMKLFHTDGRGLVQDDNAPSRHELMGMKSYMLWPLQSPENVIGLSLLRLGNVMWYLQLARVISQSSIQNAGVYTYHISVWQFCSYLPWKNAPDVSRVSPVDRRH